MPRRFTGKSQNALRQAEEKNGRRRFGSGRPPREPCSRQAFSLEAILQIAAGFFTSLQVWLPLLVLGIGTLAILALVTMGPSLSASANGASDLNVSKTASSIYVHPNEVVTYTISLGNAGTVSASVTLTDTIPWGVAYIEGSVTGGATHSDGKVTWSGTVESDQTIEITFQVLVAEPGTEGPLPIYNQACADDGAEEICDAIFIYSGRYKVYLPLATRGFAPSQP